MATDTTPWDPADAFDHISETAVYALLLDEHGDLSRETCKALGTEESYLGSVLRLAIEHRAAALHGKHRERFRDMTLADAR